jgi:hypothetical protein
MTLTAVGVGPLPHCGATSSSISNGREKRVAQVSAHQGTAMAKAPDMVVINKVGTGRQAASSTVTVTTVRKDL